jgi:hypothetical protein
MIKYLIVCFGLSISGLTVILTLIAWILEMI